MTGRSAESGAGGLTNSVSGVTTSRSASSCGVGRVGSYFTGGGDRLGPEGGWRTVQEEHSLPADAREQQHSRDLRLS
jgi:hypothetical protein